MRFLHGLWLVFLSYFVRNAVIRLRQIVFLEKVFRTFSADQGINIYWWKRKGVTLLALLTATCLMTGLGLRSNMEDLWKKFKFLSRGF